MQWAGKEAGEAVRSGNSTGAENTRNLLEELSKQRRKSAGSEETAEQPSQPGQNKDSRQYEKSL